MFSKNKKDEGTQVDTLIGNKVSVKGTLNGEGDLRIDGKVEGEIILNGNLFVGNTGIVNANIQGKSAVIAGEVNGNVLLSGKLEMTESAKVTGDIEVAVLVIHEGAMFKGQTKMTKDIKDQN